MVSVSEVTRASCDVRGLRPYKVPPTAQVHCQSNSSRGVQGCGRRLVLCHQLVASVRPTGTHPCNCVLQGTMHFVDPMLTSLMRRSCLQGVQIPQSRICNQNGVCDHVKPHIPHPSGGQATLMRAQSPVGKHTAFALRRATWCHTCSWHCMWRQL